MKILITGGLGYLGSALLAKIKTESIVEKIVVLDNYRSGRIEALAHINDPRFRFIEGDVANIFDLDYAMNDIDCVVHLAALVNTPLGLYEGSELYKSNVSGTENLLEKAIERACKKVIFASSLSVYGPSEPDGSTNFSLSPYPKSKREAEQVIVNACTAHAMTSHILRFGILYGEAPVTHFDSFINNMTLQAALKRRVTVFGNGRQKRGVTFIEDAAETIIRSITNAIGPGVFDVFNEITTPMEIAGILSHLDQELEISLTDQDVRVRYDILPKGEHRICYDSRLSDSMERLYKSFTLWNPIL